MSGTQRKGPQAASSSPDFKALWLFAAREHTYLGDYIRYGDQKAAFALALSMGAIAYSFSQKNVVFSLLSKPGADIWALSVVVGMLLEVIGAAGAWFALLPRLRSSQGTGFVFWEHVLTLGGSTEYVDSVMSAGEQNLVRDTLGQCFYLAGICRKKFGLIKVSLWAATIGSVFLFVPLLLFTRQDALHAVVHEELRSAYVMALEIEAAHDPELSGRGGDQSAGAFRALLDKVGQMKLAADEQAAWNLCVSAERRMRTLAGSARDFQTPEAALRSCRVALGEVSR